MAPLWPLTFSSGERPRALWALLFKIILNNIINKINIMVVTQPFPWQHNEKLFLLHSQKIIQILNYFLIRFLSAEVVMHTTVHITNHNWHELRLQWLQCPMLEVDRRSFWPTSPMCWSVMPLATSVAGGIDAGAGKRGTGTRCWELADAVTSQIWEGI